MNKIEKGLSFSVKPADAAADLPLINRFALKELTKDEVFAFKVALCNNDVDRDGEAFTTGALEKLAKLFEGKTGITDHRRSADRQIARLYRLEVETSKEKNQLGEPFAQLIGSAYMLRNEAMQPTIDAIEGGILKEVSVSCAVKESLCSVCRKPLKFDWRTWTDQCETGHIKGELYDGKKCIGLLDDPKDAYEFSFVAVPAQPKAGVTKSAGDPLDAFEILMSADLSNYQKEVRELIPRMQGALIKDEERAKRAAIVKAVEKYR